MTVVTYKSTDASAPSLTGAVGSLVALLDACLVNGYGAKAAAGWTKPYTATNKAVFRMATSGNTGFYLDVNDAAPTTAKEAQMRGYEVMTAVATGTGPFPTVAQLSFGTVCRKSTTADATARVWYLVANNSCFHLFIDTGDFAAPAYALGFSFGDFYSYKASDTYGCAIIGRNTENVGTSASDTLCMLAGAAVALTTVTNGQYAARSWTGTGASVQFCKHTSVLGNAAASNQATGGSLCQPNYPNGPDSALELAPIWLGHNSAVRGYMKGLWCPLHYQATGHGDTFSGTGNMAGKTFLSLNMQCGASTGMQGQMVIETSDTWS